MVIWKNPFGLQIDDTVDEEGEGVLDVKIEN
jgi:hypothetical protein